jgi:hypothetical protein
MTPAIISLADAFVAALKATNWVIPLAAERHYVAYLDRDEQVETMRVVVVPGSIEDEAASRGECQEDMMLRVGLQMAVQQDDRETMDKIVLLMQQIRDSVRLQVVGGCAWIRTSVPQLFIPESLAKLNQFTSEMQFTFRGYR